VLSWRRRAAGQSGSEVDGDGGRSRREDLELDIEREYPSRAASYRQHQQRRGVKLLRSMLVLPLLRVESAIGVMIVMRHEVRPFTAPEVALLEAFADQAVIAIENTRLFRELQEANGQLVKDVQAIVGPLMDKNDNALIVECPEDIGAIQAGQTKVRQALFNLLSNAAKFTDHGQIELRVTRSQESGVEPDG
jgi:K+-sensing histidine kinase KdpD